MAKFTDEQQRVIDAQGKIIVSAPAGSGKTTVMIGKILQLLKDGVPLSSILAVTFTTKAAAQMKEKLRKEMVSAINGDALTDDQKRRLKAQLPEVATASVSTIHSFCAKLIRSHFFEAEVDGGFSIIAGDDDAVGKELQRTAINDVFSVAYEGKDKDFIHLLDCYWYKKSDKRLRETILTLYGGLRENGDYENFLLRSGSDDAFDDVCQKYLRRVHDRIAYYRDFLAKEYQYFQTIVGCESEGRVKDNLAVLNEILETNDLFAIAQTPWEFRSKENKNKNHSNDYTIHLLRSAAIVNAVKQFLKDEVKILKSEDEERSAMQSASCTARALAKYILLFDERYEQLKKERSVLDYSDLQMQAYKLLGKEEVLKEVKERYSHVFVDEYQDVNPLQESILSKIGGENVFLVGDVKQSIYAFRGGKAKYFIEKEKSFATEKNGHALSLRTNFRSADKILEAVNVQFSKIMREDTSCVNYKADGTMHRGGLYPEGTGQVTIHLIEEPKKTKKENVLGLYSVKDNVPTEVYEEPSKMAQAVRDVVQSELHQKFYDIERKAEREITYGDIAILSKKRSSGVAEIIKCLAEAGIPVTSDTTENVCDFPEIQTLLDVLRYADNPEQDIPLFTCLLSPIGNMTANELAKVRIAYPEYVKNGTSTPFFRDACKAYAQNKTDETASKLNAFFDRAEGWRISSAVKGAGEFLTEVLTETGLERALLARDDAVQTSQRIERFIAETYADGTLSVHAFLDRLASLDYEIEFSAGGGENSVRVMTIHGSKGLEFPVVLLVDMGNPFHKKRDSDDYLDDEYGVVTDAYDTGEKKSFVTLMKRYGKMKEREDSVKDELNLYYVALTRAKERLHMFMDKKNDFPDSKYGRTYAELTDFSVWEKYFAMPKAYVQPYQPRDAYVCEPNATLVKEITDALAWQYGYTGLESMPIKSSATQIIARGEDLTTYESERPAHVLFEKSAEDRIERGLAYHAFLECFPFEKLYDSDVDVQKVCEQTIEEGKKNGVILDTYAPYLAIDKCVEILQNPVFAKLQGKRLFKEQCFLVALPLKDCLGFYNFGEGISQKVTDEEVLFQGAIDLLAVDEDGEGATVVDYKYSQRDAEYLRKHYAPQLLLYKKAVAKILQKSEASVRCTIVNLCHGYEVSMDA